MIEGYFDPAGRPYVRAYVVVPGLQPAPEATALLLDTGADNTFIQPAGARILGISTQDLSPTGTSRGIGGTISYGTVPAFIAFQERPWPWRKTRLVYFQTELAVAVPDRGNGSPDGTPDQGPLEISHHGQRGCQASPQFRPIKRRVITVQGLALAGPFASPKRNKV